ncbi:hypothetical protein [Actinomadura yumaensis]|uniref:Uncharacterized protein n=1 Tax=Actinomadura yumaensis TaxID=111807 RepID=A0ABW2CH43_9ACTN
MDGRGDRFFRLFRGRCGVGEGFHHQRERVRGGHVADDLFGAFSGGGEEEGTFASAQEAFDHAADGCGLGRVLRDLDQAYASAFLAHEGFRVHQEAGQILPFAGHVAGEEGPQSGQLGLPPDGRDVLGRSAQAFLERLVRCDEGLVGRRSRVTQGLAALARLAGLC